MSDLPDIFDDIEREVLAAKLNSERLESSWKDWAHEIVLATHARDSARRLKSCRELALEEILPHLEDWAPMEAPWGEEVDLSKVDPVELAGHIDAMFGGKE
ncbi:hypothetical protein [Hyphomicrobium sp. DY-1]|uniref:hypothetical protein n=1 Tax=Hyphomicrobium sp. DY-1 TaxID=3075650 RepID=UPI0039C0C41C